MIEVQVTIALTKVLALAYFYCDYKSSATHDCIAILGSLVKQLALQSELAFNDLEEFYDSHVGMQQDTIRRREPEELCRLITTMAAHFESCMLIIDGLDEISKDRSVITDLLQGLNNGVIKTLFSSRPEVDIKCHLNDYVQISIAAQSSDLKLYVASEIERRSRTQKLRIQDPDIKEEIMERLVEKAEGM
jgi:hypothetical protein